MLELLLDRKASDARHAREVAARESDLVRLQDYIDTELAELQQRQAQVRRERGSCVLVGGRGVKLVGCCLSRRSVHIHTNTQ